MNVLSHLCTEKPEKYNYELADVVVVGRIARADNSKSESIGS